MGVPCGGLGTYVGDVNIGKGLPWGLEGGPWGEVRWAVGVGFEDRKIY